MTAEAETVSVVRGVVESATPRPRDANLVRSRRLEVAEQLGSVAERSKWQRNHAAKLAATDAIVVLGAIVLAQWVRFGDPLNTGGYPPYFVPSFSMVFATGWLYALVAFGTRSARVLGTGNAEYRRVVSASFWTFGAIAIVTLLFKADIARGYLAVALPIGTLGLVLTRWAWQASIARSRTAGRCRTAVLALGEEDAVRDLVTELVVSAADGYDVVGVAIPGYGPSRGEHLIVNGRQIPIVGDESDVLSGIRSCGADTVAIAGTKHLGAHGIRNLIWDLEPLGVDLLVSTGLMDVARSRFAMRPIAGLPLLHVEKPQYRGAKGLQKRAFDVCFALAVLAVTWPLMVLATLAIKLTSKGPILHPVPRIGADGQPFSMLRFRTTKVDRELRSDITLLAAIDPDGGTHQIADEHTVTTVGRLLRRSGIDDLPKFINVLRREMSVVGPRPPRREEVDAYDVELLGRLLVRPGVTGLWRVGANTDLSWNDSVRLDLSYVDNWSMTSDVMIMTRTWRNVFRRANDYDETGARVRGDDKRAQDFVELHRRIACIDDQLAHGELLQALQRPTGPYVVSFVNAHAANLVWRSPALFNSLMMSDLLLRDGIGMQLGLKAFGRPSGLNMNGTDLIPQIAGLYSGRRAALFGTCAPWLDRACAKLEAAGVTVVASHHGFSPAQSYVDSAVEQKPDLIILAMGMPKQEIIATRLREQLAHPVLIVNGGAVVDFLGGKVTRAPRIMQSCGVEWLYRLLLEPRRLAHRYVVGIPVFVAHLARARLSVRHPVESNWEATNWEAAATQPATR